MKNFYEATVTRPTMMMEVCLELTPVNGPVVCVVKLNNNTIGHDGSSDQLTITEKTKLHSQVPLIDPIEVSVQLINRVHPDALEASLVIDSYNILPNYQHLANPPTCYLDTNNIWQFKIENFYTWLHDVTGQGWIA